MHVFYRALIAIIPPITSILVFALAAANYSLRTLGRISIGFDRKCDRLAFELNCWALDKATDILLKGTR